MDEQPRRPLRIIGGPPAPPLGGFPLFSRDVCRQLHDIMQLSPADRADLSLALRTIEKNGEALRTVALNAHLQDQIDSVGRE